MKRFLLLLIFILACATFSQAQVTIKEVIPVSVAPAGSACVAGRIYYVTTSGVNYERINGVCTPVTSGGTPGNVVGPASATANDVPLLDATGKILTDSGKGFSTDGTFGSNSDAKVPTEKAVKTYADTKQAALGFTPENSANKDAASGYAGLDASTLLKGAEFPVFTGDATKPSGSLVTTVVKVNGNTPGGTCTNQFTRSIDSSGRPTCASVAIGSDVSGLGTGVATAAAVNGGSVGSFVVNGQALGTPLSGTVTNLTGTASININGTVGATSQNTGQFTSIANTSQVITSAVSPCFSVGPNGDTNPVVRISCGTASQADGISITGGAAGAGTTIAALSSGPDSAIILTPKGSGKVSISSTLLSFIGGDSQLVSNVSGDNLYLAGSADATSGFRTTGSIAVLLDTNNNGTTDAFFVKYGSAAFGGGTELFRIARNGQFTLNNLSFLTTPSAANLQLGAATGSGAATDQALTTQGRTGSDVSGGNLRISSGLGTGIGTVSTLALQSPLLGVTGSTAQVATTGLTIINGTAKLASYAVASLPSASVSGAGAMAYVTDSTATAITGLGLAVVGGGANKVVVVSDGTNWIVQ